MILRNDPCLSSPQRPAAAHDTVKVVSSLENSIDGSGPWTALHLLDPAGRFIEGGWLLTNDLPWKKDLE